MEAPKIQLSSEQFIRAITSGVATDVKGTYHSFANMVFKNVLVDEPVYLMPGQNNSPIQIQDSSFHGIEISNGTFLQKVTFSNTVISSGLKIQNSQFNKGLIIESATIQNGPIQLINCTSMNGGISINKTKIGSGGLYVNNSNNLSDLSIREIEIDGQLQIDNCKINTVNLNEIKSKSNVLIQKVKIEDLRIDRLITANSLLIYASEIINSLKIYESSIASILNFYDTKILAETIVYQGYINCIRFSTIKEKSNFRISDIKFQKIQAIYGFQNLGYMQWNNLKPQQNAEIEILNSMMGRWDIVSCDFSQTDMVIYSSKITDAFYTNTKFPSELSIPEKIGENENPHDIKRDGYNQLKTLAQKQNDRKLYLHYQAAELRSYKSTLRLWKDWKTIFQLYSMRISNEYGTNWWRGLWFVLGFNFFFVTTCSLDKIWAPNFEGIGNYLTGYFASLFSLISVPKYFTTNWEIVWFYISRIFIAFGIYQTIAAFRKFGKSE